MNNLVNSTNTTGTSVFRLKLREWGFTYARCPVSKEDMVFFLRSKFERITYICVCEEIHKDGAPHLHAHVQLSYLRSCESQSAFDYTTLEARYHPKIELKIEDSSNWNTYVKKTNNFIEEGTFNVLRTDKRSKKKQKLTNRELLTGDLVSFIDTDQISLFSLPGLLKARFSYNKLIIDSSKVDLPLALPNPWGLDLTLLTTKRRHFWLYSLEPNFGKSTWLKTLLTKYRAVSFNCLSQFQSGNWAEKKLVCVDGNSKIAYHILELMCDGSYQYQFKGCTSVTLDDPYIIICTNRTIESCYPNMKAIVLARFIEFNLADFSKPYI